MTAAARSLGTSLEALRVEAAERPAPKPALRRLLTWAQERHAFVQRELRGWEYEAEQTLLDLGVDGRVRRAAAYHNTSRVSLLKREARVLVTFMANIQVNLLALKGRPKPRGSRPPALKQRRL